MTIYDKDGAARISFEPEESSTHEWGIMADDRLALTFYAEKCTLLAPGDWVEFCGARFWLFEEYKPTLEAEDDWKYDVAFLGVEGFLSRTVVLDTTDGADEPLFVLTAPARQHVALIVDNINRRLGTTDWKVGEVVVTENIEIDYSGKTCADVLSELAEGQKTEWWRDGQTLNLSRCELGDRIALGYGKGLTAEIECTDADNLRSYAWLYPVGSTRNIDPQEYGTARLRLPDGIKRVAINPAQGIGELVESAAFEEIYPRYVATVATVYTEDAKDDEGDPFQIYRIQPSELPFDPNDYEIAGLVKTITFQSGELRGREFEVNYDSETHLFEIITQWPYDDDTQLPGGLLVPHPGDTFVVWNIRMPESYYSLAEEEFLEAAEAYAADARKDISTYQAPLDYIDVRERGLKPRPGQRVRLESDRLFPETGYYDSRIISISQSVTYPDEISVQVSSVRPQTTLEQLRSEIGATTRAVKTVSTEFPDIVKSWEETAPSDTTLYSSRKSEKEFLNKRRGGTVEGPVTHRAPLCFGDYAEGPTGAGGRIDAEGRAELESLTLRRFLSVPQLDYNRVGATVGDEWWGPAAGVILTVDTEARTLELKLEEGEIGTPRVGDLCMGIFHSSAATDNATADYDDGHGNRRFAGFATCYFRIAEALDAERNGRFRYDLRPASAGYPVPFHPQPSMTFIAYGSDRDPARRTSRYATRTYERYLRDVATWEFDVANIAAQFGDLGNLSVDGTAMSGYSAYLDNIYLRGLMQSTDGTFVVDSRTKSLLLTSAATGMGLAFNPEAGLTIGAVYDPVTGRFATEYDLSAMKEQAANAEQTANAAAQQIAGLQVGGRNLLDGSATMAPWSQNVSGLAWEEYDGYEALVIRDLDSRSAGVYTALAGLDAGSAYVASVWVHVSRAGIPLRVGIEAAAGNTYTTTAEDVGRWRRIELVQTAPAASGAFVLYAEVQDGDTVALRNAQLEEGNKATAWTLSEADRQAASEAYTDEKTDYRGTYVVDASRLDQNTYYPVTLKLGDPKADRPIARSRLKVYVPLGEGASVSWSTHGSGTFSCLAQWSANGSGWGSNAVDRIFEIYMYSWTANDEPPVGSIGQMENSSLEYIYVRGGGIYTFDVTNAQPPVLHSSTYEENGQSVAPRTSVERPVTQQQAIAETSYLREVFAQDNTTIAGGLLLASMLGVRDTSENVVAGLAGRNFLTNEDFTDDDRTCPVFFAGAASATQANSAPFRVYADGGCVMSELIAEDGCYIGPFYLRDNRMTGLVQTAEYEHQSFFAADYIVLTEFFNAASGIPGSVSVGFRGTTTTDGGRVAVRIEGNDSPYYSGLLVDVSETRAAMEVKSGYLRGLRRYSREVSSTTTLTALDDVVFVTGNTSFAINLPDNPLQHAEYEIIKAGIGTLNINSGKPITRLGVSTANTHTITDQLTVRLKYNATHGVWYMTLENGNIS